MELCGVLVILMFLRSFPLGLAHLPHLSLSEECSPELG